MADRRFIILRAVKGTELARGILAVDGTVNMTTLGPVTLPDKVGRFPDIDTAVATLETTTSDTVRLVWDDG